MTQGNGDSLRSWRGGDKTRALGEQPAAVSWKAGVSHELDGRYWVTPSASASFPWVHLRPTSADQETAKEVGSIPSGNSFDAERTCSPIAHTADEGAWLSTAPCEQRHACDQGKHRQQPLGHLVEWGPIGKHEV